jgi:hypothetical protein
LPGGMSLIALALPSDDKGHSTVALARMTVHCALKPPVLQLLCEQDFARLRLVRSSGTERHIARTLPWFSVL